FHGQQIADTGAIVISSRADQTFGEKIVVKRLESRMLDDRQDVYQTPWFLPRVDAVAVLAFEVGELGLAPHQAQAAADGLFQQDLSLAGTKRNDHADVVDIEALA